MPMQVAVAISGRGSNLQALLDRLGPDAPARVALVLSNRDTAGGVDLARSRGVPVAVLADPASGSEWLRHLRAHGVDLLVLAGYLKLVPAAVVEAYRGRILNIHPALLPAFGGPGMYGERVHAAVLASGSARAGPPYTWWTRCTTGGRSWARPGCRSCPVTRSGRLAARVLEVEHRLLPAAVLAAARAGRPVSRSPWTGPGGAGATRAPATKHEGTNGTHVTSLGAR